jgi:hypothetical protein
LLEELKKECKELNTFLSPIPAYVKYAVSAPAPFAKLKKNLTGVNYNNDHIVWVRVNRVR